MSVSISNRKNGGRRHILGIEIDRLRGRHPGESARGTRNENGPKIRRQSVESRRVAGRARDRCDECSPPSDYQPGVIVVSSRVVRIEPWRCGTITFGKTCRTESIPFPIECNATKQLKGSLPRMKRGLNMDNVQGIGVISIPSISVFHLCSTRGSFTRSGCDRHHVSLSPWGDDHNQNRIVYQKPPATARACLGGALLTTTAPLEQRSTETSSGGGERYS